MDNFPPKRLGGGGGGEVSPLANCSSTKRREMLG